MTDKVELNLKNLEEVEFNDFYDKLEEMMEKGEEVEVSPDSKINARDWVAAYLKLSDEIEFLKKEYIPALKEKFIEPNKEKVEKYEQAQDFIKQGLLEFLANAEESKVSFPDLGTLYVAANPAKIIYPEDEDELIQRPVEEKSDYVKYKPVLDKERILKEYKETGEIAIDGLTGIKDMETVRIRKASKKKKGEKDEV